MKSSEGTTADMSSQELRKCHVILFCKVALKMTVSEQSTRMSDAEWDEIVSNTLRRTPDMAKYTTSANPRLPVTKIFGIEIELKLYRSYKSYLPFSIFSSFYWKLDSPTHTPYKHTEIYAPNGIEIKIVSSR